MSSKPAKPPADRGPLSISSRQAGVIALFLFLVVCLWILVFGHRVEHFVYEQFLAEDLERRFGFRGGILDVTGVSGQRERAFVLVYVDPDGPLGQSGFMTGDSPWGHMHDNYVYFHKMLQQSCSKPGQKISILRLRDSRWQPAEQRDIPCPDALDR